MRKLSRGGREEGGREVRRMYVGFKTQVYDNLSRSRYHSFTILRYVIPFTFPFPFFSHLLFSIPMSI